MDEMDGLRPLALEPRGPPPFADGEDRPGGAPPAAARAGGRLLLRELFGLTPPLGVAGGCGLGLGGNESCAIVTATASASSKGPGGIGESLKRAVLRDFGLLLLCS